MYSLKQLESGVCAADGFYADGVSAGLKANGAKDMAFIYSDTLCDVAAVFTTNKMAAAPLKHFKAKGDFQTNFVIINSKNANAMTGQAGVSDIEEVLSTLPSAVVNPVMSSTGVIGVRLPKEKIIAGAKLFDLTKRDANAAARAIMTTDSFSKEMAFEVTLSEGKASESVPWQRVLE